MMSVFIRGTSPRMGFCSDDSQTGTSSPRSAMTSSAISRIRCSWLSLRYEYTRQTQMTRTPRSSRSLMAS